MGMISGFRGNIQVEKKEFPSKYGTGYGKSNGTEKVYMKN